ncbi:protein JSN1, partial [Geosmithia morbida]
MSNSRAGDFPLSYPARPPSQPRSASPSAGTSPIDPMASGPSSSRPPFGLVGGFSASSMIGGNPRSGAGSPSHDLPGSSRLYSKRAREIQAQEGIPGLPLNLWGGPPTSGNSTPLRENIPESPTDGFPDFAQLPAPESLNPPRRARAGTVPSRFPPGIPTPASHLGAPGLGPKLGRPSQGPFNQSPSPGLESSDSNAPASGSALLSRLRAGSLPQRSQYAPLGGSSSLSPFGPSIFSSWNPPNVGRERGSTLASIASVPSNDPSSPSQSHFSRDGPSESDVHMRTLDYLGLAETPQHHVVTPYIPTLDPRQASRIRSYSVNNTDLHADEYPDDDYDTDGVTHDSQYATLQDQLERTNAAIRSHNMAVQAFANTTRRRAQTAGALDNPAARGMGAMPFGANLAGGAPPPGPIRSSLQGEQKYDDLPQAVADLNLGRSSSRNAGLLSPEDQGIEGPTSALWLGNIPTSTTTTTLEEMFKVHGNIVSVRVLTHKNCGFVNYERVESAIAAKANMNGRELFPGAAAIRINFAKPASPANTPGHDGAYPSPSPDPFAKGQDSSAQASSSGTPAAAGGSADGAGTPSAGGPTGAAAGAATVKTAAAPTAPELRDSVADILAMVERFGATADEVERVSQSLQNAISYTGIVDEIPPIKEPTPNRVHDAPKLRDLRKRIDNNSMPVHEIEDAAMAMLPEIAELSSDYLGNTVVQKLFDNCSNPVKDAMLAEITPHLAEIGCHKNGTWAAQRIIDVSNTPEQKVAISKDVHPYTYALLLDQFGNYVVQCCLKFGTPYNQFIFETMMSHMARLSHARFGSRAMRACLESHFATAEQLRMIAAQVAIHSVTLATDQNGALLLTWYLDTCNMPHRRAVLAPRLVPYLVHLCTHKVAYLTVLKVINQKAEPEARDLILNALFFTPNDEVLTAILNDSTYGATFIFKVLTTPFFEDKMRVQIVEKVRNVLHKIKAQSGQGYKRLMDEVGLSRNANGGGGGGGGASGRDGSSQSEHRQRPNSRHHQHHAGGSTNGQQGPNAGGANRQQPQPQPQPQVPFYNGNGNTGNINGSGNNTGLAQPQQQPGHFPLGAGNSPYHFGLPVNGGASGYQGYHPQNSMNPIAPYNLNRGMTEAELAHQDRLMMRGMVQPPPVNPEQLEFMERMAAMQGGAPQYPWGGYPSSAGGMGGAPLDPSSFPMAPGGSSQSFGPGGAGPAPPPGFNPAGAAPGTGYGNYAQGQGQPSHNMRRP